MRIYGNKKVYFSLYTSNTLLLLSGISIVTLSIIECIQSTFASWYDISFASYGLCMALSSCFGYFARSRAEQMSLYLSMISIIASLHISFTIGILVNDDPGEVQDHNKAPLAIYLTLIGIFIITSFILGCSHRYYLQNTISSADRMISLESSAKYNIN